MNKNDTNIPVTAPVNPCRRSVEAFTNPVKTLRSFVYASTDLVKIPAMANLSFPQSSERMTGVPLPFSLNAGDGIKNHIAF